MESQELVHINGNNAVAQYNQGADETGLEDIQLKPSNIILVQNTTRKPGDARPGQLLDTLSGEVYDSIVAVPLRVTTQRVMFPPGEVDLEAEPICRSNDGIVPSKYVEHPQSKTCASCPNTDWINGKKSACAQTKKLLFVMKDNGIPYYLNAKGLGVTALNASLQVIKKYVAINDSDIKAGKTNKDGSPLVPLKLYDFFFTVGGHMESGKFRFAVLTFDKIKRVANPGDFGSLFTEFVLRRKLDQIEAEQQQAAADTDKAFNEVVDAQFVPEV